MSDLVDDMRNDISKVYLNTSWKKRVAHMPDKQVMAIYYSFLEKGKFGHVPKPKPKVVEPVVEQEPYFSTDQACQLGFDI